MESPLGGVPKLIIFRSPHRKSTQRKNPPTHTPVGFYPLLTKRAPRARFLQFYGQKHFLKTSKTLLRVEITLRGINPLLKILGFSGDPLEKISGSPGVLLKIFWGILGSSRKNWGPLVKNWAPLGSSRKKLGPLRSSHKNWGPGGPLGPGSQFSTTPLTGAFLSHPLYCLCSKTEPESILGINRRIAIPSMRTCLRHIGDFSVKLRIFTK